nr:hypothetical protein [Candidatus Sigynarchaeum springense]
MVKQAADYILGKKRPSSSRWISSHVLPPRKEMKACAGVLARFVQDFHGHVQNKKWFLPNGKTAIGIS